MKLFKRNKGIVNRKVTRARFLYLYVIFGSMAGLGYFIASLFLGFPKHFALSPIYLLVCFVIVRFLVKNWLLIWLYIRDKDQGRLLLFLNDNTHWTQEHKLKVVNWVYLRRKTSRKETKARIANKIMEGKKLLQREKKLNSYRFVFCPQQIRDGFNEALLVHCLIYAHNNIQILDKELRDIMNLTDENMFAFDIMSEYRKAGGNEYDKYIKIGEKKSKELEDNKC